MNEIQAEATPLRPLKVKLIGVLASVLRRREVMLESTDDTTVSDIVETLLKKADSRQFSELLIDSATGDPRTNVIILVNDQDCNVLKGLKTRIPERAVVTIIPIAHGG